MDKQAREKLRAKRIGKQNPNDKGGKSIDSNGYVTLPAPERGKGGQRKYEHRVKAHAKRGVPVHHVDRNRSNNSRGNLENKKNHPRPSAGYWRKALKDW